MSAIFYQKYWNIVGPDVTNMVLNVLNSNMSMADINKTNITIVPKTKHPTKMKDFHPISLSNVAYKLISKVLANRLKAVLPQIISENQSAFLSERLITDNVLVAFELMHYLDHKKEGNESFTAIKLDMSKAYDRVKWMFVEKVMRRLGLNDKYIGWIMKCISIVSYFVLINGEAHGSIVPSRRFRQGDPLSSYLFLLYTKAFSALIADASSKHVLNGISICKECPKALTFSLRMIAYYFVGQRAKSVTNLSKSYRNMKQHQGKKSALTIPQSSSAITQLMKQGLISWKF